MWELASRASPTLGLWEAAMPFLEDLHAVVGHHAQLGVLDGREVLFVERLSAPGAVVNVTKIAGRLPLHASSAGLVLLAHASADLQETIISGPLRVYTPRTITDPRVLRATLAQIRQQGFVHCPGYIHPDASGLAVPVQDRHERLVAAVSVVVPADERALTHLPVLRAIARRPLIDPEARCDLAETVKEIFPDDRSLASMRSGGAGAVNAECGRCVRRASRRRHGRHLPVARRSSGSGAREEEHQRNELLVCRAAAGEVGHPSSDFRRGEDPGPDESKAELAAVTEVSRRDG
jgi:hypothetical protein